MNDEKFYRVISLIDTKMARNRSIAIMICFPLLGSWIALIIFLFVTYKEIMFSIRTEKIVTSIWHLNKTASACWILLATIASIILYTILKSLFLERTLRGKREHLFELWEKEIFGDLGHEIWSIQKDVFKINA